MNPDLRAIARVDQDGQMSKARRNDAFDPSTDALFAARARKTPPYEFVLDALGPASPTTRPMFGCLAVYVEDRIVLVLRDKESSAVDNGVWLATTKEHHASLRREFPHMRSIRVLGEKVTGWQVLPADAPDFEEAALRACELLLARDPRIGKVPKSRPPSKLRATKTTRPLKRARRAKQSARSRA
jgi:hypothetical protein